ncbi:MAG: exosortase H, partial [Rudaea sp.]
MLRFIFLFLGSLVALFTLELLQPVQHHVILPFTAGLAHVAVWFMQVFDHTVVSEASNIRRGSGGPGIEIVAGCNGVEAVLILISAVLAFPSPWKYKLFGVGVGFVAIQALNLVRIISLYYLLLWNRVWFDWFHLYLW